ncbi:uncharacterized protein LOC135147741 [Daucus carota subsp. sativus]|uniref:uncharacterized protein LOC135147741 n=1 Tax=Daucus carota subsp. sativus TaxID=79200 RepID=UPI003082E442
MANEHFAAALRNLGGIHSIPKPTPKPKTGAGKNDESGSSRQEATGGESSAAMEKVALGGTEEVVEAGSQELVTRGRKRKQVSAQKAPAKVPKVGRGKGVLLDSDSDSDDEDDDGEGSRVPLGAGKYSAREIIKIMSEIPTEEDWVRMDDSGMVSTFKELGSLWGQLGSRLAGFNTIAFNLIKSERDTAETFGTRARKAESDLALERSAKEKLESELEKRVKEAETRLEAEWKRKLEEAETRAGDSEKRVAGLEEDVGKLKKQLEDRKEPEVVIADFKESEEYKGALANAAAAEVVRCWNVAERHIKTDPVADLNSFINLYIQARDDASAGKGEPEPFEGPSPSFIAPANPVAPVDAALQTNNLPPAT